MQASTVRIIVAVSISVPCFLFPVGCGQQCGKQVVPLMRSRARRRTRHRPSEACVHRFGRLVEVGPSRSACDGDGDGEVDAYLSRCKATEQVTADVRVQRWIVGES